MQSQDDDGSGDNSGKEADGSDEKQLHGSSLEEVITPDQCLTDGQKIAFLGSLGGTTKEVYKAVVNTVAEMKVSSYSITGLQIPS